MGNNNDEAELIQCIYTSAESINFSRDQLLSLLERARVVNSGLGITGMLMYEDGSFFQVLEGPPNAVRSLYKKISADKRHRRITKIIEEPVARRLLPDWSMGYSSVTREELKEVDGLNDFFQKGKCYADLDECRAKKLLDAFKDGRWRASLG